MKILVYGAGAVGGYLAAKLLGAGHDVTVLVRPTTAVILQEKGFSVTENGRLSFYTPRVATSLTQAFAHEPYELIIMGLKSYDLADALAQLKQVCPHPQKIMTTQNGIGIEQMVVQQFGAEAVLAGSFTIPISKRGKHHLMVERSGLGLALAPVAQAQPIDAWVTLFQQAGLKTSAFADYQAMKWSKAYLNIVANASSAILNMTPALIYQHELLYDLEIEMLSEMRQVMRAKNIPLRNFSGVAARRLAWGIWLTPRFVQKPIISRIVGSGRGDKMPSFYIDLAMGKQKNEVVFHNGAIAQAGQEQAIATPVNQTLAELLCQLAMGARQRKTFDGRPHALLEEVEKRR